MGAAALVSFRCGKSPQAHTTFSKHQPNTRKMPNVGTHTGPQSFYTVVWIQFDCYFFPECCGPNGPPINTRVTLSPQMLSADYVNGYLFSNHLPRKCQFLAFLQSSCLRVSLSHFIGSYPPSCHPPWPSLLLYMLSHCPHITAPIILQKALDPSSS